MAEAVSKGAVQASIRGKLAPFDTHSTMFRATQDAGLKTCLKSVTDPTRWQLWLVD
jgi:hypothetical protein